MKHVFILPLLIFVLCAIDKQIFEPARRFLRYKEEFYRLYYLPSYYSNDDLLRNIGHLQTALRADFAPPLNAIVVCENENQYKRYRRLLVMHIYYLLTQNHVYLAARFDKHEIRFYNTPYAEDIVKSLAYARYNYECALNYWNEAVYWKNEADAFRRERVDLEFTEDIAWRMENGELDYRAVIEKKLEELENKKQYFSGLGKQRTE
ncbi:MAG: hypothetical protein A2096_00035 [Spirochaetes bacterium GWF1_41_5]|nr:MAG: hypothetical protein A2096_00035 [Spirochaetes bacterium GWF1_41_5]